MTLELNEKTAEILEVLIDRRISELYFEIHHTDSRDYRQQLKQTQEILVDVRNRLSSEAAVAR